MKNIRSLSLLLVTAVLLATYSGCNSIGANKLADSAERFNPFKRLNSKEEKEPEYQTPKSMVAIWKASTLQQAGTKSIRGFGGRFYFYDANNDVVRVNGDLTIYGYDDRNRTETGEGKADRKFVFEAKSLNSHFSESALGESYSFWVPWDEVGGEEKTITLIPVFKTVDGLVPEAKPATIRLPGKPANNSKTATQNGLVSGDQSTYGVVQASAELASASSDATSTASTITTRKRARRTPTTLRLTPGLAEHLATPVQRTQDGVPNSATDKEKKDKPSGFTEASSNNKTIDEKVQKTSDTSRPPRAAPTAVFGRPGAFR